MAIEKTVNTEFGVDATYWNIGAIEEDFKGKGITVTLYGYVNKESRLANKQPLGAAKVQLSGDEYVADASRESIYPILMKRPEFDGAKEI